MGPFLITQLGECQINVDLVFFWHVLSQYKTVIMFKNYIKVTLRNLWKNKTFSFLNIMGLAIGIASAALIFLWVEDEMTFNHHFAKKDYVYRIMENQQNDGRISTSGSTPGPMAEAVKSDIPGIKNAGRLSWNMDELIVLGDKSIKGNGAYVDPSVLTMLGFHFIYGDAATAFKELQSVVINESLIIPLAKH